MTEKCIGEEIKYDFFEQYGDMAEYYRTEVRHLVGDNLLKIKDMIDDWQKGDRPVDCVKSFEFPYDSFPAETKYLMTSKLSKEIKCPVDQKCSSNFVDDAKRTWFGEMKKQIINIKRKILRSTNDETCKMNMDALEKKGFTKLKITEQEEILNKIENHCFSDLYDTYQKWYDFYGQDVKCMAQLGGIYPNPGVSDYDGKCPGKYFFV